MKKVIQMIIDVELDDGDSRKGNEVASEVIGAIECEMGLKTMLIKVDEYLKG